MSRRWPQILPNGKALIYTTTRTAGSYDDGTIVRTVTFTTASQSDYIIEIDGTNDGTVPPFFVSERITYAT